MARDDDDPLFAGILSWWAVLGLGTAILLSRVAPAAMLEELPDAWVRVAQVRPRAQIVRPAPIEVRVAPDSPTPRTSRPAAPKPRGPTFLERLIGTSAESKRELVTRLFEDGGEPVDLREAAAMSPDEQRLRTVEGPAGPADIAIGRLGGTGDGPDLGVALQVRAPVAATVEADAAAGTTRRLPEAQVGSILYCYEKRLLANPELVGRIEIAFAERPRVVVNDTGDPELASCIDRVARRWTIPRGFDTDATYPVLLRRK